MRERRAEQDRRRAREFEAFVAGAAGRLLHAATLLTGNHEDAERLLTAALARTYAAWDRLHGEDPYDRTRQELAARFAHTAWRHRHPGWGSPRTKSGGGLLDRLTPQQRLVLVLRLYEGVAEEQAAAQLGLPTERVRAICLRSVAMMRSRASGPSQGSSQEERPGGGPDTAGRERGPYSRSAGGGPGAGVAAP
ncbi:sigma factor-like helix-turn-helix DNA-binding protein [Streptomyces sp. NPDC004647]|uniref:sigma factor-like helix-turn-helix DNA-binding protein n=1 Tax=Streptomyces sp. NPDC004647 TaxID=3154671 RepID=UPI0033BD4E3F